jgi:hypothetical protein
VWTRWWRGGSVRVTSLNREQHTFPFSDRDKRQLARRLTVRALDREVAVEVPGADDEEAAETPAAEAAPAHEARQSLQIQAQVARLGAEMGFRVWVPRNDRVRVLELIPPEMQKAFLDRLPLNYDDTTLQTIEQIDVIWLKGRSMARAFEVEHTTAVYSGLLRMADLLFSVDGAVFSRLADADSLSCDVCRRGSVEVVVDQFDREVFFDGDFRSGDDDSKRHLLCATCADTLWQTFCAEGLIGPCCRFRWSK